MENIKRMEKPTEEKCERCGAPLVIKWGRHGSFYACSTYDKDDPNTCTFTKENPIDLPDLDSADMQETSQEEYCENCGRTMVLKRGRFGQFMACSGYPECKYVKQNFIGVKCPECKTGEIVEKRARRKGNTFYGCSNYPKCKFTSASKPLAEKCPKCGGEYLVE